MIVRNAYVSVSHAEAGGARSLPPPSHDWRVAEHLERAARVIDLIDARLDRTVHMQRARLANIAAVARGVQQRRTLDFPFVELHVFTGDDGVNVQDSSRLWIIERAVVHSSGTCGLAGGTEELHGLPLSFSAKMTSYQSVTIEVAWPKPSTVKISYVKSRTFALENEVVVSPPLKSKT